MDVMEIVCTVWYSSPVRFEFFSYSHGLCCFTTQFELENGYEPCKRGGSRIFLRGGGGGGGFYHSIWFSKEEGCSTFKMCYFTCTYIYSSTVFWIEGSVQIPNHPSGFSTVHYTYKWTPPLWISLILTRIQALPWRVHAVEWVYGAPAVSHFLAQSVLSVRQWQVWICGS